MSNEVKNSEQIKCKDCGCEFEFSTGEQTFYKEKNFPAPIRCPKCRIAKKQKRQNMNAQV